MVFGGARMGGIAGHVEKDKRDGCVIALIPCSVIPLRCQAVPELGGIRGLLIPRV
tara:strand:- start:206 stop:370 length:165 start_codon:yes stop_codon:yes gene_type:complete